ncbi:MAG TPA: toprim domain-containing protein [Rhabdochlamydiaceae bacterium]|jgi:twinkle protein
MSKIVELHKPCPSPNCSSSNAYCKWDDGHGYCFSCHSFFKPNGDRSNDPQYTYEYLPWRGVTKESFEFYGVKTKIAPNGEPLAIGFPYPNSSVKHRYLDKKDFRWSGDVQPGLFGMNKFTPGASKYITITEGELDAISLRQALLDGRGFGGTQTPQSSTTDFHVVSVSSASSAVRDCTSARSWLDQYERILLCFDEDAVGLAAARRVATLFDSRKVYHVRLGHRKDANDFLQVGDPAALKELWWKAKKFMLDTITSTFAEMRACLFTPDPPSIPFPWQSWNNSLYGLRQGESYLITALEGVGKTEVMHHLEHHLLKETDANVGSIFLEEPTKDHYKAIARLELRQPVHLPNSGVDRIAIAEAVEKVTRRDERLFVHTHHGSDNPDTILDTIRFLVTSCDCKYILLDHIGMACVGLEGDSERIALDYMSNRLQMMVVELGFCLIVASHVNDFGETRGSRMIAKVANNRINLFRDVKNGETFTHVHVAKNRFGSKTGPLLDLCFNLSTFSYTEYQESLNNG